MTTDLWRLDAVQLASRIRVRDVSARDATTSVLERIETLNPRVNALVEVMRDEA